MSRAVYERLWHDDQVTRVHLHLAPGTDPVALRSAIAHRFGDRYRHLPALGNRRYQQGGEIEIADYAGGCEALRELQAQWAPLFLMCVCAEASTCHRTYVGSLLRADGFAVTELSHQAMQEILTRPTRQLPLF